jgi:2-polyprenyl-6-methoxyphenol hydroxylase-like FAD-dependent oxidoreductase
MSGHHATGGTLHEPARETPVAWAGDICVVGGSCTGVFAAVRAARRGLRVALIERHAVLGGMAVAAQVNEWHSLHDTREQRQIIGGLTWETVQRLQRRGALLERAAGERGRFRFNSAELAAELDRLIDLHQIRVFLAATCVGAIRSAAGSVSAVVLEDSSGRRAVQAEYFLDASGDAVLLRHAGFAARRSRPQQPVTLQALFSGLAGWRAAHPEENFWQKSNALALAAGYPSRNSRPWTMEYPGAPELTNVYGPRISGVDGSDADATTRALLDGRRHLMTLVDAIRAGCEAPVSVVAWPAALGVRQTWQANCLHQLAGDELLSGESFDDRIAHGTYPIDVHHAGGTSLRYLDGREETVSVEGAHRWSRWRDEAAPTPACYHIPYRALVPYGSTNLLVAGRVLDADRDAFGGVRVMVNLNQTGEAAGEALALAVRRRCAVGAVDATELRAQLNEGGSLLR